MSDFKAKMHKIRFPLGLGTMQTPLRELTPDSLAVFKGLLLGGSVAEWLACWTQAQKGWGSNRSHDAVG